MVKCENELKESKERVVEAEAEMKSLTEKEAMLSKKSAELLVRYVGVDVMDSLPFFFLTCFLALATNVCRLKPRLPKHRCSQVQDAIVLRLPFSRHLKRAVS